ncbi:MAG: Gfo/Idh/MocA family protein [Phycisphaeraceae bacterium]
MANGRIRVGIVGLGTGRYHISPYRHHPQCEVVALADPDAGRRQSIALDYQVERAFSSAEEMFASGEVDAVSIATPNATHAPLTLAALDAGLHVLVEKPMAMNAGEAEQMLARAHEKNLKLGVHFNHRMNPAVQFIGRYAEAGELGEIYFARTTWHRNRGIPARASLVSQEHAGGGVLIDLGVHMLDQTLYVMGYPRVASVSAAVHSKFHQQDVPHLEMDVEDFATAYLRFETGATLVLELSWASHHSHPEQMLMQVYGSRGGAKRKTESYHHTEASVYRREHGAVVATKMVEAPHGIVSVQQDFIQAILDGREPACSGQHGLTAMRVLDAIYESSRQGREVQVRDDRP